MSDITPIFIRSLIGYILNDLVNNHYITDEDSEQLYAKFTEECISDAQNTMDRSGQGTDTE